MTASENTDRAQDPAKAPMPTAVTNSLAQNRSGTARTTFMIDRVTTSTTRLGEVSGDMARPTGRASPQPRIVDTMAIWNVSINGSITLCRSMTQSQGMGQNFSQSGLDQTCQKVDGLNPTVRPAATV